MKNYEFYFKRSTFVSYTLLSFRVVQCFFNPWCWILASALLSAQYTLCIHVPSFPGRPPLSIWPLNLLPRFLQTFLAQNGRRPNPVVCVPPSFGGHRLSVQHTQPLCPRSDERPQLHKFPRCEESRQRHILSIFFWEASCKYSIP